MVRPGSDAVVRRRFFSSVRAHRVRRLPARLLLAVAGALTVSSVASAGAPPTAAPSHDLRPILISIDDLPLSARLHPEPALRRRITQDLLAVLAEHHIPAIGMVIWSQVRTDADRELLDLWLAAGHELGNHSDHHLDYTRTPATAYITDVEAGRKGLASYLAPRQHAVRFFRFPMLREGDTPQKLDAMRDYLAGSGQRILPVTIDDQDWSFEEPWVHAVAAGDAVTRQQIEEEYGEALRLAVRHHERMGDRLAGRVLPQILLLHATQIGTVGWDPLFTWLEQTGHRFVGPDELLSDPIFDALPRYVGTHGPGLWDRMRAVQRQAGATEQIRALLATQSDAWNRGDLDAFCSVYADDARFLSPSGVTSGKDAVLARYRRRYPDREAMGRLTLEVIEIRLARGTEVTMMGDATPGRVQGASVAARWHLARKSQGDASGLTLIVLAPTPDGWRILQDASM